MHETVQEAAARIFETLVNEASSTLETVHRHMQVWLDQRPCFDEEACQFRRTVLVELMECRDANPVEVGEALKRLIEARLRESVAA